MVIILIGYAIVWVITLPTVYYYDYKYSSKYNRGNSTFIAFILLLFSSISIIPIACRHEYYNDAMDGSEVINLINWAQSPEAKADVKNALLDGKVTKAERDQVYRDNEQRQIDNFNYGD